MKNSDKLEIGCGINPTPGYLNTDFFIDQKNKDYVDQEADARDLPFEAESFVEVLAFGVIEHFGRFEVGRVFNEAYRVLKPGGVFKFDVPDFDWFVHAYMTGKDKNTGLPLNEKRDEEWILKSIFGGQDGPGQYHKWGYNQRRIEIFLLSTKFKSCRLTGYQWRDPEHNHLIWECIK